MLAFREKSADLEDPVKENDFVHRQTIEPEHPGQATMYQHVYLVRGFFRRGAYFTYNDGFEPDGHYFRGSLAPGVRFVSTASVSTYMGRNAFDEMVQFLIAKSFRNRYGSLAL